MTDVSEAIPTSLIDAVCERLRRDAPVKRALPGGGSLSIDRELPFLCVYRRDPRFADTGTRLFANHESSYLSAPGNAQVREGLSTLVFRLAKQASLRYESYLILEIRGAPDSTVPWLQDPETKETEFPPPAFTIYAEAEADSIETINALRFGLERIRLDRMPAKVDVRLDCPVHPPGLRRLLTKRQSKDARCVFIGLEISPIYRDPSTGDVFPKVLEELRTKVSKVLKKAFFAFASHHTSLRPHHYYSLGRSRIPRTVWEIDRRLSEVSDSFDPLLLFTPINVKACWREFKNSKFQSRPAFRYRPLPFDPYVKKRELLEIPVERVDDPTLAHLLRSTQDEIDRQLTMLTDIGSSRFRQGSLQVFGGVSPTLLKEAEAILDLKPASPSSSSARTLGAVAFAHRAERELESYRQACPTLTATVEVREDMYDGLMVSGDRLLVGHGASIPNNRVKALLAHEIGTHLVTRHNGARQPLTLLETGLCQYDPLQEGLAVLSEYLVDGLSEHRLRLLAGRVVATHAMLRDASFSDTFHLMLNHGFSESTAYTVTFRIYRGGGLTKDAAYLRGLGEVLGHLHGGGELHDLYIGKLALSHVPLLRELLLRNVLAPPSVLPNFLSKPSAQKNLERVRKIGNAVDLARSLQS